MKMGYSCTQPFIEPLSLSTEFFVIQNRTEGKKEMLLTTLKYMTGDGIENTANREMCQRFICNPQILQQR